MRLWHPGLLPYLPTAQISGQHRECCALRGNGWGRKHKTVDYVFTHSPATLFAYHQLVMAEAERRGSNITHKWKEPHYRGRNCEPWIPKQFGHPEGGYLEHDGAYLRECLENLQGKGVIIRLEEEV